MSGAIMGGGGGRAEIQAAEEQEATALASMTPKQRSAVMRNQERKQSMGPAHSMRKHDRTVDGLPESQEAAGTLGVSAEQHAALLGMTAMSGHESSGSSAGEESDQELGRGMGGKRSWRRASIAAKVTGSYVPQHK